MSPAERLRTALRDLDRAVTAGDLLATTGALVEASSLTLRLQGARGADALLIEARTAIAVCAQRADFFRH